MSSTSVEGNAQELAYRWLKQRVATLPRETGVFLTENEAARETGISRTPVREAMLRLEAEGFLKILPKKGAYVPPITDEDVKAVMDARALVEEWCARKSLGNADLVPALKALLAEQRTLVADPVAFIDCDRRFHGTVVASARNPMLTEFYESLRDRQLRMGLRAVTAVNDRARRVLAEHAAIVKAIRAGSAEAVAAAVNDHLTSTLQVLCGPTLPDGRALARA